MKIYVRAHGFEELRTRLERLPRRFIGALDTATREATNLVAQQARENIFQQFRNRHGGADAMASAIGTRITRRAESVTGTVGFGPGLPETRATPWMHVHEKGAVVHHPGVFGRLQVFQDRGIEGGPLPDKYGNIFTMRTRPHDISIPARPFLQPALDQKRNEVIDIYRRNVFDVVKSK